MIRIDREPKPSVLQKNDEKWLNKLLNAQTKEERKRAENKYRHPEIKETLVKMFNGKCAYCESKITHIDYGHIEHYRPKSKFREFTSEWANLLLACGVCNGAKYKGVKFPEADASGPIVNPCEDNPNVHLKFVWDSKNFVASVYGISPRGELTELTLGLNRDELREYRSEQIKNLLLSQRRQ